nr:MAG TPA: hypothetical protein [Caudoviricetes sp.]
MGYLFLVYKYNNNILYIKISGIKFMAINIYYYIY